MTTYWKSACTALLVVLCAVACSDSDMSGGTAELQVMLTDAPSDYIASAEVTVSRVYLKGGDDVEGDADLDLVDTSGGSVTYDLLTLQDGIEALLAEGEIPATNYGQLRFVVESAVVTLAPGVTFTDGSSTATLFVPSGMESGIKVLLAEPIEAEDGSLTVVVVDFDVDENFIIHGDPTVPDGVTSVQFTPLLNEKSRNQSDAD